jgi:hypothetical protein
MVENLMRNQGTKQSVERDLNGNLREDGLRKWRRIPRRHRA